MKNVINSLLANGQAQSDWNFSAEELQEEAVVVDEQIDSVPETEAEVAAVDAVEETEEQLEAAEKAIDEAEVGSEAASEAAVSLENLVELLSMESADLTPREYSMVMATANSYLAKAGIDSSVMSFEEEAKVPVAREEAKTGLAEKAKTLFKAGKEAFLKMVAEIGKFLASLFDSAARLRNQLVAMGKSVNDVPTTDVEIDGKYQYVMDGKAISALGRVADKTFGEHCEGLKELADYFINVMTKPGEAGRLEDHVAFRPIDCRGLPGEATYGVDGDQFLIAQTGVDAKSFEFHVPGKLSGEKPVRVRLSPQVVRTQLAEMIHLLDQLKAGKKAWDAVVAETKKAYADESFGVKAVSWAGVNVAVGLFNRGPRQFASYAVKVVGLRAQGLAVAIKKAKAPAAATGDAGTQVAVA